MSSIMKTSLDPTFHRDRERQFIEHVRNVLEDDRLRIDTTRGRRPLSTLIPYVAQGEPGVERGEKVKRLMLEMGIADRELQSQMPVGERITVTLRQRNFWRIKKQVGRMQILCLSPTRSLLAGETPQPLDVADVNRTLGDLSKFGGPEVPVTVVLMSTSGFTQEEHALAARTANRTLLMAEPNDAGGWSVSGPSQLRDLTELFDPELQDSKRRRVEEFLEENKFELTSGGVATDKIAAKTQLPLQIVESAVRSYAKENPGFVAKRIEGRLMLYREGSAATSDPGGSNMPFWETIRGIFKREESTERKIARLAAERAGLTHQRERAYDEIASVEKREAEITKTFATATVLAQRRIATEISQLRKDIERRQQSLSAIDKKINVVNTGIHTLELKQQVDPDKLKTLENIASSAEDAEEVEVGMAALQQLDEEANATTGVGTSEVPDDVQAILDELSGKSETPAEPVTSNPQRVASTTPKSAERNREASSPAAPERKRNEPEPG